MTISSLHDLRDNSIVFISIASKDLLKGNLFNPGPLLVINELTLEHPNLIFLQPSIQNYTVIHAADNARMKTPSVSYSAWKRQCEKLMSLSDCTLLLPFPSWKESNGVNEEIQFTRRSGKPVLVDILRLVYFQSTHAEASSYINGIQQQ